ncbi:uncharacterized protein LAJ45_05720 [Morchella importuna]|uniref:uncharacterized protein n=1 Tax=Morchella importuna TaxID=1174673 RepID=UPI001E8D1D21|nr:uncharacterized protein LAJ45_05720 [Morchella importuna]KAH8150034.1 hypothetical protein LAJ45_05720 [Morchella importuna]
MSELLLAGSLGNIASAIYSRSSSWDHLSGKEVPNNSLRVAPFSTLFRKVRRPASSNRYPRENFTPYANVNTIVIYKQHNMYYTLKYSYVN